MRKLDTVPDGIDEIKRVFGNPDIDGDWIMDGGFLGRYTAIFALPFAMRTWNGRMTDRFRAHRMVGPVIQDAMESLANDPGAGWLRKNGFDFWGGCWWFRKMTTRNALSTHSWGIAVDINPFDAPYGEKNHKQPACITEAFKIRGFDWGGDWRILDAMHFQACTGY